MHNRKTIPIFVKKKMKQIAFIILMVFIVGFGSCTYCECDTKVTMELGLVNGITTTETFTVPEDHEFFIGVYDNTYNLSVRSSDCRFRSTIMREKIIRNGVVDFKIIK